MLSFIEFIAEAKDNKVVVHNFLKKILRYYNYSTQSKIVKEKPNYSNINVYTKDRKDDKRAAVLLEIYKKLTSNSLTVPSANVTLTFEQGMKGGFLKKIICYYDPSNREKYINICQKPSSDGKGKTDAGVKNETDFEQAVKMACKEAGQPINIEFQSKNSHSLLVKGITGSKSVGRDTANRKKSDVTLLAGNKEIPISIKQNNADIWESSDTLFGKYARNIFERLDLMAQLSYTKGQTEVKNTNKKKNKWMRKEYLENCYTLDKEFQIKITDENLVKDICFGKDLTENGIIVQQTFTANPLEKKNNNTYVCKVTWLATSKDVKSIIADKEHCPYLVVGNNKGRANLTMGYRDLRLRVTMGKRSKNTRTIDPEKLPSLAELKKKLRYMSESVEQ